MMGTDSSQPEDEFSAWDRLSDEVMQKYADVWETLARGHTDEDLAIAAILRSIVKDIEGPAPADWGDIADALRWILAQKCMPSRARDDQPWWDNDWYGTDNIDANTTNDMYEVIVIQ